MADWVEPVTPTQGVTAGTRMELVYGGDPVRIPDPETVRFVVGGRPGFIVEGVDVSFWGHVHVTGLIQTTGQIREVVPLELEVPVSDDITVTPLAGLNLAGLEVVSRLERIRYLGAAGVEQVEDAADEDETFRENLGGQLRDDVAGAQGRLRVAGVAAGAIAAVLVLGWMLQELTE